MGVRISPPPPTPGPQQWGGEGCEGCGVGLVFFFSFCSVVWFGFFFLFLAVEDLNCTQGWEMGGGRRADLKAGGARARAGGKQRCKP